MLLDKQHAIASMERDLEDTLANKDVSTDDKYRILKNDARPLVLHLDPIKAGGHDTKSVGAALKQWLRCNIIMYRKSLPLHTSEGPCDAAMLCHCMSCCNLIGLCWPWRFHYAPSAPPVPLCSSRVPLHKPSSSLVQLLGN